MLVAILVICFVLVLRYLDQKNRVKDRLKQGGAPPPGPADFETINNLMTELSERIGSMEAQYRELAQRLGVPR
jgi:hypothetical protein